MDPSFFSGLPICTVGYLLRERKGRKEVYLSTKAATPKAVKRKIAGKLLGFGGDFEPDKDSSVVESFARELGEESDFKADPKDMRFVARILIRDENGPRLVLDYVLVSAWSGEAGNNREFTDSGWYPTDPLPDNILGADKLILPRVFRGELLEGYVEYDANMAVVSSELAPVDSLVDTTA